MTARTYAWLLVAALWVVALLNYVDRQVIFSLFPLLSRDLSLSPVQLGLLSTVFLWVYGVLSPFAGYAADRFGRGRIIGFSLLIWSAITVATALSRNYTQLILARGLIGLSEACYLPAALAQIAQHHRDRSRSLATGIHQSGLYLGLILGGAGGGWAGEHFGWRAPFLALGAIGVVYAAVLTRFLRATPAEGEEKGRPARDVGGAIRELFSLPGFGTMTTVFSATAIANWVVYTWLPLYLYERLHMGLAEAGFTATFYIQAASFGGILLGGWLADRWSATAVNSRLYTQAGGVLLASPFLFLVGVADSRAVLIAALLLYGVGRGFYDCNTMPVLCQVARDDLRSTGYGIFNCAGCVAGGVVAAMAGALKNVIGLGAAFELAGAILLVSGLLLLRIRRKPSLQPPVGLA